MRFGISTHLFHDSRLDRDHLAQIAAHGFERSSSSPPAATSTTTTTAAIAELAKWLAEPG